MVIKVISKSVLAISALISILFSIYQVPDSKEMATPTVPKETYTSEVVLLKIPEPIVEYRASQIDLLSVHEEEKEESQYMIEIMTEDVEAIARTLYGECRGVFSDMEKAAVAWVILNRLDCEYGDSVLEVVSEPDQFIGYDPDFPVTDELAALAEDVLVRWNREKLGDTNVGRVLPADYLWFHGDGERNYFRDSFIGGNRWGWYLDNPYEN